MIITIGLSFSSCKKTDNWLNEKTNKNDVVPETLADYQAILDNTLEMNNRCFSTIGLTTADNLYLSDEEVNASEFDRIKYLWEGNYWYADQSQEWNYGYRVIEFSNLILEGIRTKKQNDNQFNNVKGQAHFFRAIAMYNLVQLFCKPYVDLTAGNELGLPIRESSDVNIVIHHRASLKETYAFIITDLQEALRLLPATQQFYRPTTYAALGLIAKVYLAMEDYSKAGKYADQVLSVKADLLDFNNKAIIQYASENHFPANGIGNPEVIFYAFSNGYPTIIPSAFATGAVASELYGLYDHNDLRKSLFFTIRNNLPRFMGTYTGNSYLFAGIGINELYLIRAEINARAGNTELALKDLNLLLKNRYKMGSFIQIVSNDVEEVLRTVLQERRKELPFTGNMRWEDLRRLNLDTRFQKTIDRMVNNKTYRLVPNDKRYTYLIPQSEIQNSGIEQNEK